jgi:hypothetical protein
MTQSYCSEKQRFNVSLCPHQPAGSVLQLCFNTLVVFSWNELEQNTLTWQSWQALKFILCAIQRTPNIQCFGATPESCCTINELQKSYLPISIVLPMSMQQHQQRGKQMVPNIISPPPISEFVRSNDFIEEQVKGVVNQSKFYQDTRNSKRLSKSWYLCSWSPPAGQPLRPCFKRLMCIRKSYECNMMSFQNISAS